MRVVILTLQKVQIKDPTLKLQKISVSLRFGESLKELPKPRFIRNKSANFYGEKISVSSSDASAKNVLLSIYGGAATVDQLLGEVVIDVQKLEKKQDSNEFFQIEDEKFNMEFEAMYSSSMSMSPRNLGFSPRTPNASDISETTTPSKLGKNGPSQLAKSKQELDLMKESSLNKLKALEKAEVTSPTQQLRRQQSGRKLNRTSSNLGNEEDRKSEISEKPASKRKFQRTNSKTPNQTETENTKSESAYRPRESGTTARRDRSVTPTKSVKSDRSNISITARQQKPPVQRKPKVEEKPKEEEESAELGLKDYLKFIVISVVAMMVGVAVKQW